MRVLPALRLSKDIRIWPVRHLKRQRQTDMKASEACFCSESFFCDEMNASLVKHVYFTARIVQEVERGRQTKKDNPFPLDPLGELSSKSVQRHAGNSAGDNTLVKHSSELNFEFSRLIVGKRLN